MKTMNQTVLTLKQQIQCTPCYIKNSFNYTNKAKDTMHTKKQFLFFFQLCFDSTLLMFYSSNNSDTYVHH